MTRSRVTCGLGYSPSFLTDALCPETTIHRLEAGPSLLKDEPKRKRISSKVEHFSLHLSRAPFSESPDIQDAFINHLASQIDASIDSVGLHLCGPLNEDLGRFGLGTGFLVTPTAKERSLRLLKRLTKELGIPILIENADFYYRSLEEAQQSIAWSTKLAHQTGAGIILDLAHLHIAAHNLGVPASYLLGQMDLNSVEVVHLSGTTLAPDGMMHDGHNKPVSDEVWELAKLVLQLSTTPISLILEHTDPGWADKIDEFRNDWKQLTDLASQNNRSLQTQAEYDYSKIGAGYFANIILPQRYPELKEAIGQDLFHELVTEWATAFFESQSPHGGTSLIPFLREVDRFLDEKDSIMVLDHFRHFVIEAAS